eukprot:9313136-Alexandrium_andersonii.AAC.1
MQEDQEIDEWGNGQAWQACAEGMEHDADRHRDLIRGSGILWHGQGRVAGIGHSSDDAGHGFDGINIRL